MESIKIKMDTRAKLLAATSPSRYALNGAAVGWETPKDGQAAGVVVTTDGRGLAIRPAAVLAPEGAGAGSVLIRADSLPNPKKRVGDVTAILAGGRVQVSETVGAKEKATSAAGGDEPAEGTFPPFGELLPTSGQWATFTVNPRLLADLAEAVSDPTGDLPGVTFYCQLSDERYAVKSAGMSVDAVVWQSKPRPILAVGCGDKGGVGIMMPINADAERAAERYGFAHETMRRAAALIGGTPDDLAKLNPAVDVRQVHDEPSDPDDAAAEAARLREQLHEIRKQHADAERRAAELAEQLASADAADRPDPELRRRLEMLETDLRNAEKLADEQAVYIRQLEARPAVAVVRGAATPTPAGDASDIGPGWTTKRGTSKRGRAWVAHCPPDRLADDVYAETLERVKQAGGWWSRAWNGEPGGFAIWAGHGNELAEILAGVVVGA